MLILMRDQNNISGCCWCGIGFVELCSILTICMEMSKFWICLMVALCTVSMERDSINWAREEVIQKVLFSRPHWLETLHWLSRSQLCSRALRGWETMKIYPKNISSPFAIDPSSPSTPQVGEITESSPRRTHCKIWVCLFDCEEIIHLPSTASPTSGLSSKARLPCACITGYATTPPYKKACLLRICCLSRIINVLQ